MADTQATHPALDERTTDPARSDGAHATVAAGEPGPPDDGPGDWRADAGAALDAAQALARSVRDLASALLGLARSEWQLARASVPVVIALMLVFAGLSLSLWVSVMLLAGWGLYVATGSVGWALVGLVGLQLVLLVLARALFVRAGRNLTMPATRDELHGLFDRGRERNGAGHA